MHAPDAMSASGHPLRRRQGIALEALGEVTGRFRCYQQESLEGLRQDAGHVLGANGRPAFHERLGSEPPSAAQLVGGEAIRERPRVRRIGDCLAERLGLSSKLLERRPVRGEAANGRKEVIANGSGPRVEAVSHEHTVRARRRHAVVHGLDAVTQAALEAEPVPKTLVGDVPHGVRGERPLQEETGRDPSARPLDVVRRKPHVGNRLLLPSGVPFTSQQGNSKSSRRPASHPESRISGGEISPPPSLDVWRLEPMQTELPVRDEAVSPRSETERSIALYGIATSRRGFGQENLALRFQPLQGQLGQPFEDAVEGSERVVAPAGRRPEHRLVSRDRPVDVHIWGVTGRDRQMLDQVRYAGTGKLLIRPADPEDHAHHERRRRFGPVDRHALELLALDLRQRRPSPERHL